MHSSRRNPTPISLSNGWRPSRSGAGDRSSTWCCSASRPTGGSGRSSRSSPRRHRRRRRRFGSPSTRPSSRPTSAPRRCERSTGRAGHWTWCGRASVVCLAPRRTRGGCCRPVACPSSRRTLPIPRGASRRRHSRRGAPSASGTSRGSRAWTPTSGSSMCGRAHTTSGSTVSRCRTC